MVKLFFFMALLHLSLSACTQEAFGYPSGDILDIYAEPFNEILKKSRIAEENLYITNDTMKGGVLVRKKIYDSLGRIISVLDGPNLASGKIELLNTFSYTTEAGNSIVTSISKYYTKEVFLNNTHKYLFKTNGNNLKSAWAQDSSNNIIIRTVYTYLNDGALRKQRFDFKKNKVLDTVLRKNVRKYLKTQSYFLNGLQITKDSFTQNNANYMIEIERRDSLVLEEAVYEVGLSTLLLSKEVTYYRNGQPWTRILTDSANNVIVEWQYLYDDNNKLINKVKNDYSQGNKYIYNNENLLIEQTEFEYAPRNTKRRIIYRYNENGLVSESDLFLGGIFKGRKVYEYNPRTNDK